MMATPILITDAANKVCARCQRRIAGPGLYCQACRTIRADLDGRNSLPPAGCSFPQDNRRAHRDDTTSLIRFHGGRLYINGFGSRLVMCSLEEMARDVLNVVLDPVPAHLVTPFAEEVIATLGVEWLMSTDTVEAWAARWAREHAIATGHAVEIRDAR